MSRISRIFLCHLCNLWGFCQQRISLITLIVRDVRVICCSHIFIRFIWFIWCFLYQHRMPRISRIFRFRYRFCFRFRYRFRFRSLSFSFSFSFSLVAHSGTRTWCHALPWWALCCSLSSRTASSLKQKYLDYDYVFPPMESNHRKAVPGAGSHFVK